MTESETRTGMWVWKHTHKAEGTVTYQKMEGGIVFDGVDFGYNDDKMVLRDIRMYAQPGQKIALVGSTGAGKTTITNLSIMVMEQGRIIERGGHDELIAAKGKYYQLYTGNFAA